MFRLYHSFQGFRFSSKSIAVLLSLVFLFALNVSAATFVVNTTADTQDAAPGNGTCADANGECSLRAAISEANALAGADTITLPAGTYTHSLVAAEENANAGGDYDIDSPLTINGAGSAATIIQSNAATNTASERVFHILSGGTAVTISGVTIQNGKAIAVGGEVGRGGGIRAGNNLTADSAINLTVTNSTIQNNRADTRGGGIAINKGNLTVAGCTIINNIAGLSATAGGAGGGLLIDSQDNTTVPGQAATITNTIISNNLAQTATGSSFGGGVILRALNATMTFDGCTVNNNTSTSTSTAVSDAGFAGGLYNQQAHMIVNNTTVSGNVSSRFHAGIRNLASTAATAVLDISNSTISNNTSTDANGLGGGITNILGDVYDATVNIDHSTISGNTLTGATSYAGGIINVIGAFTGLGTVTITNSTISGNSANDVGGIYNDGATATMVIDYSTVANNHATGSAGDGGGIYQDLTAGGATFVSDTISADNTATTNVDITSTITSLDYNHFENPDAAFVPAVHDVTGSDPQLQPLANNGGPTQTHLPGGPVRNTIPTGTNGCGNPIGNDQRGSPRPGIVGSRCDKGSVELGEEGTPTSTSTPTATATGTPPVTVALPNVSASPGASITVPIVVSDTTGQGIISYDFQVSFNPAVIVPASPEFDATGTLSSSMSITPNSNNAGHLIISAFQAQNLSGAGTLINLKFNVVGTAGQSSALAFADYTDPNQILHPGFLWNEGKPPAFTTNGSVNITGSVTATPTGTPTRTATSTPTGSPTPIGGPTPFTFTPDSRDFGTVAIRTSSGAVRFTIRNRNNFTTSGMTYALSGPDSSSFRTNPITCGTFLGGGSTCTMDVTFTPSSIGPKTATLNVYSQTVTNFGTATLTGNAVANSQFDYDFDGKSDISIFRPTTGEWYLQRSTAGLYGTWFGVPGDKIVPSDYDGDGKADIAIYRPSEGLWAIFNSSTQTFTYYLFGYEDDLPVAADYTGDRRADVAVFRPSTGFWYWRNSSSGILTSIQFGANGDRPTVGDYDGDGRADPAVFHPSSGVWYHLLSSNGQPYGERFGITSDVLVPADYDGDGRTDLAVYRPSTGIWYLRISSTGLWSYRIFGLSTDIPAQGDYDGDGKADVCVFRPSEGIWYWQTSSDGAFHGFQFGINGDQPTEAAFRY